MKLSRSELSRWCLRDVSRSVVCA